MPTPHVIANEQVEVHLNPVSGAFAMVDRITGERWGEDPWMGAAGLLTLESESGNHVDCNLSASGEINILNPNPSTLQITFKRPATAAGEHVQAEVVTRLSTPEGGDFRIEILSIDVPSGMSFVELEYPCRVGALRTDVDEGYLVVPFWQGSIVPCTTGTFKQVPRVPFWAWDDMPWRDPGVIDLPTYEWNGISMPFHGVVKGSSAWVGIFDTELDCGIRCVLNCNLQPKYDRVGKVTPFKERLAVCSPYWRSEKGHFAYPRSMSIRMLPGGDYVTAAKTYRKVAQEKRLAISLHEKIDRNPNIDSIIGAPLINLNGGYPWYIDYPAYRYTWNNVRQLIDDMNQTLGLERALLCLWIGYQHYPPDSYPFHPSNGTVEELADVVRHGRERNFLICFYHGYPALLDHAENFDVNLSRRMNRKGEIHSRWGRNCAANFLEFAKKNLPPSIRDSGQVADYTDMLTAGALAECWDPNHPLTRSQDRRAKEELLEYINGLGLFTGSENPRGWAVPLMAYAKNGNMGGNHPILNCFRVPLFNLVYKDCMVMFREHQAVATEEMFPDLAIGNHVQMHMSWPGYRDNRDNFRDIVRVFQPFNRRTGKEELLSHRFVEEFNGPYITQFADGSSVRVNPASAQREIEGKALAPQTALIEFGDGRKQRIEPARPQYRLTEG